MTTLLTPPQHALFFRLAQHEQDRELFGHIIPIPINASQYVVYLRSAENLVIHNLGDLDALVQAGLLDYELSRMGTSKRYYIASNGHLAFRSGELDGAPFQRLTLIMKQAKRLKALLVSLLGGERLSTLFTEINFVHNLLDAHTPDPRHIRASFQKILNLISTIWEDGDLAGGTKAVVQFGKWCEVINDLL
ncbi:MAG: hypothetical protein ACPG8W_17565 [Candidatus Promineifilaceae bacterium]